MHVHAMFTVGLLGKAYAMPKEGPRWNLHASGASSCDSRYLLSPAWGGLQGGCGPLLGAWGPPLFYSPMHVHALFTADLLGKACAMPKEMERDPPWTPNPAARGEEKKTKKKGTPDFPEQICPCIAPEDANLQ